MAGRKAFKQSTLKFVMDQICQFTDKRADRTACMKPKPIKTIHKFARLQDNYRKVSV